MNEGRSRSVGRSLLLAAAWLAASVGLAGCTAPRITAGSPAPGIALGATIERAGVLTSEEAFPRRPVTVRYERFRGGSETADRGAVEVRFAADPEGFRVDRFAFQSTPRGSEAGGSAAGGAPPEIDRRSRFIESADGSVLLAESAGGRDDVTTVFDPPAVIAPASMRAGETAESRFVPRSKESGGERRGNGEGLARVTYVGAQRVTTPLGTFDADLVLTELVLDFGVVKIERTQRRWVAAVSPGVRTVVAEDLVELQRVFGLTRTNRFRLAAVSVDTDPE
ncbi:MAG: hypothetical protein AAFR96_10785 [Planctomycetota bacterium]